MAPKTSTGIVLRRENASGKYTVKRPGTRLASYDNAQTLDSIQWKENLHAGYWLRDTPETKYVDGQVRMVATVWTWVQL